jgi:hypothetical protein
MLTNTVQSKQGYESGAYWTGCSGFGGVLERGGGFFGLFRDLLYVVDPDPQQIDKDPDPHHSDKL